MEPIATPQPINPTAAATLDAIEQRNTPDVLPMPAPQTELDIAQGAPVPGEMEAYRAWDSLTKAKQGVMTLDPQLQQTFTQQWTTYRDTVKANGQILFPTITRKHYAAIADNENRLLGGLDKLLDNIPPEKRVALEKRLAAFPEPARKNELARTANYALFQQQYGQKFKPEAYPAFRDRYARQVLGLKDDTSDLAVYNALHQRKQEQQKADQFLDEQANQILPKLMATRDMTLVREFEKQARATLSPELADAASMEMRYMARQARMQAKAVEPIATALTNWMKWDQGRADAITGQEKQSAPIGSLAEATDRFQKLTPEQKDIVNTIIRENISSMGDDPDNLLQRMVKRMGNAGIDLLQSGVNMASATMAEEAASTERMMNRMSSNASMMFGMAPEAPRTAKQDAATSLDNWIRDSAFLRQSSASISQKFNKTDGWAKKSALLVSDQLPFMVAATSGIGGLALTSAAMAGQSYESARIRNPEGNRTAQLQSAAVSGTAQAAVERLSTQLAFRFLGAVPGFRSTFGAKFGSESLMRLARLENRLGRAAAGATLGAVSVGGVEFGEEIVQEAIDRTFQDFAMLPTGITDDQGNPTTMGRNLLEVLKSYNPTTEKGSKLLLTLLPFMLIGGGGGSFAAFRNGEMIRRNRPAMRAMGLPEQVIEEISTTPDVEKANTLLKQALDTEIHMMQKSQAELHAAATLDYVTSIENAWRAQGIEIINPQFDDAGNMLQVELTTPAGTSVHASVEEAQQALAEYATEQQNEMLENATEAYATEDIVKFMTEDGQRNAADDLNTRVTQNDFVGTFPELLKRNLISSETMRARLEAFALQEGITLPEAVALASSEKGGIAVRAQNFAKLNHRGAWQYTVNLFRGADPINALEDFAEVFWKAAINESIITPQKLIELIRLTEQSTGNTYLKEGFEFFTGEDNMPLWEALGAISREHALANFKHSSLPPSFRKWIETMLTIAGEAWNWFKSMMRGRDLQAAIESGQIPRQFAEMIADSVGINEENRANRVMQREADQARAEFEETGYKLSEWAKGKLLHPAQARAMNHPLARELERIYDELTVYHHNREARNVGNRGRLKEYRKNVSRAEAYFAPRTEKVNMDNLRGSANEVGFQFENIADMLDAIEESLFFNRETYSTHSGIMQSFSLGGLSAANFSHYQKENRTFTGIDGKQRFEMDASQATVNPKTIKNPAHQNGFKRLGLEASPARWLFPESGESHLGTIISFEELFQNYPILANLPVKITALKPGNRGSFRSVIIDGRLDISLSEMYLHESLSMKEALSVILHETQHAIQRIEGFATGSNPTAEQEKYDALSNEINNIFSSPEIQEYNRQNVEMFERYDRNEITAEEMGEELEQRMANTPAYQEMLRLEAKQDQMKFAGIFDPMTSYMNAPGEKEARGVQARQRMTREERDATPFMEQWQSFSLSRNTVPASLPSSPQEFANNLRGLIGEEALRLEQPRAKYEDKNQLLLSFAESILGKTPITPEPNQARSDLPRVGNLQILKQKFAGDLQIDPQVKFLGQTIASTEDLARLAMTLRNPLFETFYLYALKRNQETGLDEVVNVMAVSSRTPAMAAIFPEGIGMEKGVEYHANFLRENNATSYVIMHNHPSGDPSPSRQDIRMTRSHTEKMAELGFSTQGHIIINHKKFLVIAPDNDISPVLELNEAADQDRFAVLKNSELSALPSANSPENMMNLAKKVSEQLSESEIIGFICDAKLQPVGILKGTLDQLEKTTADELRDFSRSQGGSVLMLHAKAKNKQHAFDLVNRVKALDQKSIVFEIVAEYETKQGSGFVSGKEHLNFQSGFHDFFGQDIHESSKRVQEQASFSLSRTTQSNLQSIIEARLSRGPEERVKILETMRDRLQGLTAKFEARNAGDLTPMERQLLGWRGKELTPVQAERLRIEDAIATVKGLLSAVPAEIRAKVSVPLTRILDADTDVKTYNAFRELIQNADEVIEEELKETYTERITALLDTARPTSTEARTNKTLLTPETQRMIDQIDRIIEMSEEQLMLEEIKAEQEMNELEEQILAAQSVNDNQKADELLRRQIDVQQYFLNLGTFGKISQQGSSELARTYQQLKDVYIMGRQVRKIIDTEEREALRNMRDEMKATLGYKDGVSGPAHDRATNAQVWKNAAQYIKAVGLEHMNFHEFMEVLFPGSPTVQAWSRRAVKAMRAVKRRRLDAETRFNAMMADKVGARTHLQRTRVLEQLSVRISRPWEMQEVVKVQTEEIPLEYVPLILNGSMKQKWSDDRNAMTLLRQAWRDHQMLPAKQRSRRTKLKITLPVLRKNEGADFKSDLELLDVLMTYEQEMYRPALDRIGYTEDVIEQIRKDLDSRTHQIHAFLRSEYDAGWFDMNRVFQRVFKMDMPQIRNYAPGTFENARLDNGKEAAGSLLGSAGATSAMGSGAVKNRRAHTSRPLTQSALSKYWAHMEQSAYWMEWTELIGEVSRVLRSPDVRRAVEARHGKQVAKDVDIWIEMLNTDGALTAQNIIQMERAIANLVNSQSHIALAFNLSVPFKQASAALGALTMVPAHSAMRTFAKLLFRWNDMKKIFQSEAIQQRIRAGISPESRALMDATRLTPSMMMDLLSLGQLHTSLTDAAFTTISGMIAYDHFYRVGKKQSMTDAQAETFALDQMDYVVARTSQPADTQMKSLVELKAGHGLGKLLVQFKSDPRRAMGAVISAVMKRQKGQITNAELGRVIITQWMVYGILGQLGSSMFKSIAADDDDQEDNWEWERFAVAALLGPIEGLTVFGSIISGTTKWIADMPVFNDPINPLGKYLQGGLNVLAKVLGKDDFEWTNLFTEKAFLDLVGGFGSAMGLPASPLIPALIRGGSQLADVADNLVTSPEERLQQLAREFQAQQKETLETQQVDEEELFSKILAATGPARDALLSEIADEKLRRRLRDRARKQEREAGMTELEKQLSRMSKENRTEAIRFMDAKLSESEREAFRNRMSLLFNIQLE